MVNNSAEIDKQLDDKMTNSYFLSLLKRKEKDVGPISAKISKAVGTHENQNNENTLSEANETGTTSTSTVTENNQVEKVDTPEDSAVTIA